MPKDGKYILFLHHTSKEEIARKIIDEGFKYYDSFYKTTDEIVIDEVYLNYWFQLRRAYGKYAIVMVIAESIIEKVNEQIKQKGSRHIDSFNVLSESFPVEYEDDYLFTLSKYFVRGYYDINTRNIVFNPLFNPRFYSNKFLDNIRFIQNNT